MFISSWLTEIAFSAADMVDRKKGYLGQ